MRHTLIILLILLPMLPLGAQQHCGTTLKNADKQKLDEAIQAYQQKEYSKCGAIVYKLAKSNPRNADVLFYAGLTAVEQNNATAIRKYFGKLTSICPDYADARFFLYQGIIRYSDDDFYGAVASLQRFFDSVNSNSRPEYLKLYNEASNYLHWSQFLADAEQNKVPFHPHSLLGASSRHDEIMPFITHDGQEIYYVRYLPEDLPATFYQREMVTKVPRLCVSRWKDTSFSEGLPLPAPFNTHDGQGGITMTADGKTIFLSIVQTSKKGYKNCDIYTSRLINGQWMPLEPLPSPINGEQTWEGQPSVTPDGQYLYFASNRSGGQGGIDIWRCHRLNNGDWSRPENLGSSVNTPGNEKCPFIHADGHTLFFASNGWQGFGGYDTYFINIADPTLRIPTNLGLPINSERDDICFGVTTDGRQAYYSAVPPEQGLGGTDILAFDLYAAARPESMTVADILTTDKQGRPLSAQVSINRIGSSDAHYITDSSGKNRIALSQQTSNLVYATARGYIPWCAVGTAQHIASRCNQITLQPLAKEARTPLDIHSTHGSLTPDEQRLVDVYVDFLLQHPVVCIRIEAPRTETAKAVYDYMLSRKLRPHRIEFSSGYGYDKTQIIITQV
ncbi:MAG: PD40 domain-containing protein [Bacteroidales bacterium]|nr:PD40 domain-containing protein [Bacteroidales bacterium]